MLSSIEAPRLTTYLRAYSSLASCEHNVTNIDYADGLKEKIEFTERQARKKRLNWDKFVEKMLEPLQQNDKKNKNLNEMKSLLDRFKLNARQFICDDVDSETVKDTALYLFEVFYNRVTNDFIRDDLYLQLRPKFPLAHKNLYEKSFAVVESILSILTNEKLIGEILAKKIETEKNDTHKFGEKVDYVDPNEYYRSTINYPFEFSFEDIFSHGETPKEIKFDFPRESVQPKSVEIELKKDQEINDLKLIYWTDEFDPEVCQIIIELLSSSKSNDALQNDILDVIGFDKFETIEFLLSERSRVVDCYKKQFDDSGKPRSKPSIGYKNRLNKQSQQENNSAAAVIGSDIIIHTEAEKKIKKLIRKEEKKISKMTREDEGIIIDGIPFDPNELRQIREQQLAEAHMLHLFNVRNTTVLPSVKTDRPKYPFVFDKFSEAKKNSAFIAGSKILLPEDISRYDDQVYEQIHIPPANVANDKDMQVKLLPTSELDDVGQIAFRNTKFLNRIQSIVFKAVYYSNQNLLICAPTGAGKTNIAMLAIVNEIKKNFEHGVLRKENFKIVYIAPMKALAAEMADNFQKRLEPLGISVRELTGDMQLTKTEITNTQILVTTPEKWDVVTRKSQGDISLSLLIRLLIIDEVHLLQDDRGSVIETIVARTLRQVETSQKMIRIIGLSATLPNYVDVARFLDVDPYSGLFFFDGRFRPVPLGQTFIGVKGTNKMAQLDRMDDVCYEKCLKLVKAGHQVMVFVHARNATIKTALKLRDKAKFEGDIEHFLAEQSKAYGETQKKFSQSRNKQLREVFDDGFGVHHAGMLRQDRNLVEKAFLDGHIRVLVCTATLAWGVNLPAHAVIIKGTEVYDSNKGSFVDLSILDVLQIFGRAGRPQYDSSGEAFIITSHDKLSLYLSLLTTQSPIESQFIRSLADNLNAEVCLGTVSTIEEGAKWLSYTYLHVRMKFNPLVYGITYKTLEDDPGLSQHRADLIQFAARNLDKAKMLRYDEKTGYLFATDLGRTASHYYINYDTIEMINERLRIEMNEKDILSMIACCSEFHQLKVRDEELQELDYLYHECPLPIKDGIENTNGKVNLLIQAYISRLKLEGFSLVSDMSYVSQNIQRIARALFEIVLKLGWSLMTGRLLAICKVLEKQLWHFQHPMRQFDFALTFDILNKMEEKKLSMDKLREMDVKEIGLILHHQKMAEKVKEYALYLPVLECDATLHPITRNVIRIRLTLDAKFRWNDKIHGHAENFWIWIEDPSSNQIYHHEFFSLQKKHVKSREQQLLVFTIPIFEPLPTQYLVRMCSDRWLGCEFTHAITFKHLILPERHPPHTELLDLDPLPVEALNNQKFQDLYNFTHFNPIQTQIFHCLYHKDYNCLIGCPTGSGKTIMAELAMLKVFNETSNKKVVYIAPLKALVRERMIDWKQRLENRLGKKVVELTGDVVPDMRLVTQADVIVTTPEKWDGISRSWQTRQYVKEVALIIIDEIHLLGEDRGPVLEVIVSRTNFISSHTSNAVRIIGLSTALANARDLADWLGIRQMGLYNFKPSVRPVPLEAHITGFPGKHYCPRMATMNKPCFKEIKTHSPEKPVLIFVSSRRQTRLTAIDLISYLATESNPKQWLNLDENEMTSLIDHVHDPNLKLTLAFGIGLHHAGLNENDRRIVEELFVNRKIQILIATSTLAWGVNFPAHLVIVKGTEYYDGKTKRYVDYPITDVLQMMGRAGRPQYDDQGKAVIMVHDVKKHFYKKFLYEPFPVESCLLNVLCDHINAEIVAGTIGTKQEAIDYLTWTYFFRRLLVNPTYYQLEELENHQVNKYLSKLVQDTLGTLKHSNCLQIDDQDGKLEATTSGRIASFYYLSHKTLLMFKEKIHPECDIESLIDILSSAEEYAELPVRHNEDKVNAELANDVPIKVNPYSYDNPHTKCNLLLQAHYSQIELPSSDYTTDLKSVMDQCMRVLQAMLDFSADQGWLETSVCTIHLMQMTCMARWLTDSDLLNLPHISTEHLSSFINYNPRIDCLPMLLNSYQKDKGLLEKLFGETLTREKINDLKDVVQKLPQINVDLSISGTLPNRSEKIQITHEVIELYADEDYTLTLDLKRINEHRPKDSKAYAPKLSKPKDENWIIVLGDCENKELLALKRVSCVKHEQSVNIQFNTPIRAAESRNGVIIYDLFYMSDVYIGLDQQYQIKFKIVNLI